MKLLLLTESWRGRHLIQSKPFILEDPSDSQPLEAVERIQVVTQ
jgi:hypothetical protein